jgi:hypothetical protein
MTIKYASRALASVLLAAAMTSAHGASANGGLRHVRSSNQRVHEIIRYALTRSPSFGDLLATLDLFDRVVYVEEGSCTGLEHPSCLYLMSDGHSLAVRIDPRQPIRTAAAELAHELYHAVEIGREPTVVDASTLLALYARIGENACGTHIRHGCWETRAAQAFQELVMRELAAGKAAAR